MNQLAKQIVDDDGHRTDDESWHYVHIVNGDDAILCTGEFVDDAVRCTSERKSLAVELHAKDVSKSSSSLRRSDFDATKFLAVSVLHFQRKDI